jgi:hypothetical protein
MRPMAYDVLRLRCSAHQCDDVARLVVGARVPSWGRHLALPEAGARHERTLEAVGCRRLLDAEIERGTRLPSPLYDPGISSRLLIEVSAFNIQRAIMARLPEQQSRPSRPTNVFSRQAAGSSFLHLFPALLGSPVPCFS